MNAAQQQAQDELEWLDLELADLPADLRWREWMNRIEAVIFASALVVPRDVVQKVVGKDASIDLLIEDIQADLKGKPYEIVSVAGGWMFRTRTQYATAIRMAADIDDKQHDFTQDEMAVLCAVAYHQPIDRAGLAELFGKEINRDLLGRLRYKRLIGIGPKSPRPGAPHTFVTTLEFLATFDLQSLRDLPELDIAVDENSERGTV
ncbi:SMC-Scp complex subunit ScpB [Ahrensia marina]|uniref:Chromosome segregation protein ScpB n=1 Tax=Ahrensia marina TaxID=1514904 RepID=A0A0M9GLM4_9HYPH|nr:SMC-Scp complex subunit ScpB [Ahrensia marina]KPB00670.1 chromosome segregation protein ScpB [Ahrensia marina]